MTGYPQAQKALIALDIDGTLTLEDRIVPERVAQELKEYHKKGHPILLVTGRMLHYTEASIQRLDFPYLLAVQNGADILEMPSKKSLSQSYLSIDVVEALLEIDSDFFIYAGYERGDFCYYRPQHLTSEMQIYAEKLKALTPAPWQEYERPSDLNQQKFPLIKCFGLYEKMVRVQEALKGIQGITTSLIRDPIDPSYHLILVTHPDANKGGALRKMMGSIGYQGPVIAAGDDLNDVPLLERADYKIVVETAPKEMHALADLIARPSSEMGIIAALKEATLHVNTSR